MKKPDNWETYIVPKVRRRARVNCERCQAVRPYAKPGTNRRIQWEVLPIDGDYQNANMMEHHGHIPNVWNSNIVAVCKSCAVEIKAAWSNGGKTSG
jgi:hypothetical protein